MKDDTQLIDDTLAGDAEAFGQLVQKYQDRLFNTIAHVLGDRVEAEDVVQDAFVQAFVKLQTFQRASAFYTWLYRIAFNLSVSRRRRRRPTVSIEQAAHSSGYEPMGNEEPAELRLERQERAGKVKAALATLSRDHRAILVLREIEGCDYERIGEVLELPPGTVRSRLHRARSQLREQLKEVLQEYR